MKKALRVLSLIMTILMFLPIIVACKNDSGSDGDSEKIVSTDPADPYASKLPAYDWEGDTFFVLGRDAGGGGQDTNFEIYRESLTGDVVGDAVWTRNETLKRKYNFVVKQDLVENTFTKMQTLCEVQYDIYDLVLYQPAKAFTHAASGYLLNMNAITYLDFEHPTWNKEINRELTISGKLYTTTSQFLLHDKKRTYCMFYNRELAREYNLGKLEDYVDGNAWTLETFETVCRTLSFDIDGRGAGDFGDSFGVAAESPASFAALLYGAGFTLGTNEGDTITFTGATLQMHDKVSAVGKTWFDKTVATIPEDHHLFDYYSSQNIFIDGRALFMISFPSDFDVEGAIGESCTFELGVMPFPKYDSTQERYYNINNFHNSSLFSVPYTVDDPEQVGFYLQAISEESCKTTYTAYIESKCKVQDAYDELTARMLDLSFRSATYDVVACLNPGDILDIVTSLVPTLRINHFVRFYNAKGERPQNNLDAYMDNFRSKS